MKFRHSLIIGCLTAMLGFGAFLGVAANKEAKAEKVEATGVSGTITIDVTGGSWATNAGGQKFSIKFTDAESHEGWGSFVSGAQYEYLIEVPYSLEFTPTKMTAYRYNPSKTAEDWATNKTTSVWNTSSELDFSGNSNIIIDYWDTDHNTARVGYWGIAGKSSGVSWEWTDPLEMFTNVKLNDQKHAEYYGIFTFTQWEEFLVKEDSSYYKWGCTTLSEHVTSSEWQSQSGDDGNVQYKGTSAKDFAIYFDRNDGSIYINDPLYAEADDWALSFYHDNAACNATKSNWEHFNTEYTRLKNKYNSDSTFTDLFTTPEHIDHETSPSSLSLIDKALQRYDYVLQRYGINNANSDESGYKDFIGRAGKLPAQRSDFAEIASSNNSDGTYVAIIASFSAVVAAAGFIFLKKKKSL